MQNEEDGNRSSGEGPSASAAPPRKKKPKKRKDKSTGSSHGVTSEETRQPATSTSSNVPAAAPSSSRDSLGSAVSSKKQRKQGRRQNSTGGSNANTTTNNAPAAAASDSLTLDPAQQAVYDQMRRALEEARYSAAGSIVEGTDSEEEDFFLYRGQPVRLDRAALQQTAKKMAQAYWYPQPKSGGLARHLIHPDFSMTSSAHMRDEYDEEDDNAEGDERSKETMRNKKKRKKEGPDRGSGVPLPSGETIAGPSLTNSAHRDTSADYMDAEEDLDRDGGSIFGQTTGATNSTWVQCDKCRKWRRLRGVVDEKKLPTKWYCSMNRNDPERARCSAPEEDYDTQQTPESAADARSRKHLRVWVRRLQCQEAYEARQPTLTRGKKRAVANNTMKENGTAYEWIRCCNPSCGKWRALLRLMDAKTVMDRAKDGTEWYCVMNTWDEKMASCAAPQENLPAVGCPPWVLQDEEES